MVACGDVALTYAVEPEPLDTGGAIRFAADAAGIDSTFIVANGDVMTDLDVGELLDAHRSSGAAATIHLIGVDDPSTFGVVDLDDPDATGRGPIRQFVEKPARGTEPSNLINAGTYVFEPAVLDLVPLGERTSIERATFPELVACGHRPRCGHGRLLDRCGRSRSVPVGQSRSARRSKGCTRPARRSLRSRGRTRSHRDELCRR